MQLSVPTIILSVALAFGAYNQAQAQSNLPEGKGKELVESTCVVCHELELIEQSVGYTNERWRHLMNKMIDLPESLAAEIAHYLNTNFPESRARYPTLVEGSTKITFREWTTPTRGQRPRDPLETADGMIWWSGMYGSLIGRLNPETGEMTEFKLDPTAQPHSIASDRLGNIWYTGNGNSTVGRLDPDTGEITEFPMPDPAAKDPHTPLISRDGNL